MPRKIMLTIAETLYKRLEARMKDEGYLSVQELINSIIRADLLARKVVKKKKAYVKDEDKELIDAFSEDG